MNDEELRREYQRTKMPLPGSHPEPEQLRQIVDGEGPEAERLALLEHVLRCPTCGPELDLLRAAAAGSHAAEHRIPSTRWLAIAAAAVLVIGFGALALRGRHAAAGDDVLRGNVGAVSIIAPASDTSASMPLHLAWHPVEAATTYRVELLSTTGELVRAWVTRDTTLVIGDSAHIGTGASYDVWVRATLHDRTEMSSPMVRFSVK